MQNEKNNHTIDQMIRFLGNIFFLTEILISLTTNVKYLRHGPTSCHLPQGSRATRAAPALHTHTSLVFISTAQVTWGGRIILLYN